MPMNPRLLRPTSGGRFDPRRISGIGAWFDATDSSTYTLDTGVTEWRCKAVSGQKFSQAIGASQPAINSTGIGGKAALSFDGSNDWMNLGSQTIGGNNLFAEAANSFSLIVVCRLNSGLSGPLAKASATNAQRTFQYVSFNGDMNTVLRGSNRLFDAGSFPATTDLMTYLRWDGSTMSWRIGNTTGTANVGSAAVESENVTLGCRTASSPAVFWNGTIGEVIFYNKALSSLEQSSLFLYFNAKWGLSLT